MTVLQEKDTNVLGTTDTSRVSATSETGISREKSMQKQAVMNSTGSTDSNGQYVSPSDAIMSPASQKLANFKQRQINKQHNPARRTLFARTVSTASDASVEEK